MQSGFRNLSVFLLAFAGIVYAQAPPAPGRAALNFDAIPRPPVPADPLELVIGNAQPVQDAQQRNAAIALLSKARDLSNVRAQPYDLKTSFSSSGGLASDGNWMLEDISPGRGYRWTAQGPNYSAINLYPESTQGMLYGNQQSATLPLRLLQVRAAIFFTYPVVGTQASLRTATGSLNGAEQRCVLVVIGARDRTFVGARNWEESEYCVDANTGLLTTYSPAPGLFVHYDYSSELRFHNKTIPTGFTIAVAGQTVVEARTISVTDPTGSRDALLNTGGLVELGVGRVMTPVANLRSMGPVPGQPFPVSNAVMQMAVLHGSAGEDGRLSDVEVLASTDATLNQAALDRANAFTQGQLHSQPGATAQSREVILTLAFVTQGP